MAPDCYVVLGVARDANLSQVRRAFRELSRRLDPDHPASPSSDLRRYEDVSRAYDVLTHPAERAEHDHTLTSSSAAEWVRSVPATIGPPRHLFEDFQDHRPSRGEVTRAFEREYLGPARKARSVRAVNVDVVLAPQQAEAGGVIPFHVPAATPCASCHGTGQTGFFHCDTCGGAGASWTDARVDVVVPRGTRPGTSIPVSLAPLGAAGLVLNVTIHARPGA